MNLDCLYPAFIAGYGSGKSYMMGLCAVMDAMHCGAANIYIYEPEVSLIRKIAVPVVEEWLDKFKIKHKPYNKNERVIETQSASIGTFYFMHMDDPDALVGYQSYRSHIDELDTLPSEKAEAVWEKLLGRNRQAPKGLPDEYKKWCPINKRLDRVNRMSAYTTPEGYKFCYNMWEKSGLEEYKYAKGRTMDNPTASAAFIKSLVDKYPKNLLKAYLEGDWVNMESHTVYHVYNRKLHRSFETIQPYDVLYIGLDFNVGNMCATTYVRRNGGKEWHAVAEFSVHDKLLDTPAMIRAIKQRWPNHKIIVYPDASGTARKSTDASRSDISLLRDAGFEVRANSKNPLVKDRVLATNKMFEQNTLYVNDHLAPNVADCFEQQSYDKHGEPDKKSGNDHQNDASTYPIAYECSVQAPIFRINYSFAQRV